jgi:hypothetical protein
MKPATKKSKLVAVPNATADLTLRDLWNDEEFATYVMRSLGVLGAEETPHPLDLAAAVSVTRSEFFLENAQRALEEYYAGGGDAARGDAKQQGKLVLITGCHADRRIPYGVRNLRQKKEE